MNLTIERKLLLTALNTVKPPACGRIQLPILSNVAIRTFDKSVEFTCTNLDLTLRTKCDADIHKKGQTTVPAARLHALINSFTGDDVTLELEKNELRILCGSSKYKLGVLDYDDFPPSHQIKNSEETTLPQAIFRQMLAVTSFCSSQDQARYVLQGNFLKLDSEIITVATDGRRLALASHEADEPVKKAREMIVPAAAIAELLRLLADDDENKDRMRVVFSEASAEFKMGDTVLTTKLIEGNFPNYKQVIPEISGKPVIINRAELLTLLQRASIIQSESVRLDFNRVSLTLRAMNSKECVGDAYENMDISECRTPLKIAFNPKYLIEALKAVEDDEVLFYGTDGGSPGVFKVSNKSINAGWCYVVMPRRDSDNEPVAEGGASVPASQAKAKEEEEPVAA